jgi:hypothetical protein
MGGVFIILGLSFLIRNYPESCCFDKSTGKFTLNEKSFLSKIKTTEYLLTDIAFVKVVLAQIEDPHPVNRNLRLKTGSNAEYFILCILIAIALSSFSINSKGGVLTQFNRLIASTSGVQSVYNSSGSTHKIIANIKGVRAGDRSRIDGQFQIIQPNGTGFIVLDPNTNKLYKAATDPDSHQINLTLFGTANEYGTARVSDPSIGTGFFLVIRMLKAGDQLLNVTFCFTAHFTPVITKIFNFLEFIGKASVTIRKYYKLLQFLK